MRKSTRCIWEIFFTWALAHGTVIMPDGRYHSRYVTQSRTRNESSFHLRFRICHFWHGSRTFYWAKTAHRLHQFTWSLKQLDVTFSRKVGWTWSQPTLCNWQGALVSCPDHQIPKIKIKHQTESLVQSLVFDDVWMRQSTVSLQNDFNSWTVLLWCKNPLVSVKKICVMALTLIPQITKTLKSPCEILVAIQQVLSITLVSTCLHILSCVA